MKLRLLLIAVCTLTSWEGVDAQCLQDKLHAQEGRAFDGLGLALDLDAAHVIVGASGDDDQGLNAGASYVFVLGSSGWTQEAKLTAEDGEEGDRFGGGLGVSGAYALVGAALDDDLGDRSGSAYIFQRRTDDRWPQVAKLLPLDGAKDAFFGSAAAIHEGQFFVGADGPAGQAIYIFEQRGEEWVQVDKLMPRDVSIIDQFGETIAISGDVLIGGANKGFTGKDRSGEAYIFEREESGRWVEAARLENADHGDSDDFGESVAVEGNLVVVGASGHKFDPKAPGAGAAYVFERDVDGNWNQIAKLIADDYAQADNFGRSVGIWDDLILVGAVEAGGEEGPPDTGAVYVFQRLGPDDSYVQIDKFIPEGAKTGNEFGHRMLMDRGMLMVGVPCDDDNGEGAGAVYVYTLPECAQACCMPGGECTLDAPARCEGQGGVPLGPGVACTDEGVECPLACCESDGACTDRTPSECDGVGGIGHFGESCESFECPRACCFEDGSCVDTDENQCANIGGTPAGPGTTCDDDPPLCEALQACCFDGGECQDVTPTNCAIAAGLTGGPGTDCRSWNCLEACCLPGDICLNIDPQTCLKAGDPQGLGSRCQDDPCGGGCVRDPAWQCDGDVDGDAQVNPVDSGLVQAAFGSSDEADLCQFDVDCDGQINPVDSGIVQSLFGTCEAPRDVCP